MKKPTTYYHGGPSGLSIGDRIRPAISRGAVQRLGGPKNPRYTPHKVYVTQSWDYAALFAANHRGVVYEVRPDGPLTPDPDARGSFCCPAAVITAVHEVLPLVDQIAGHILAGKRVSRG